MWVGVGLACLSVVGLASAADTPRTLKGTYEGTESEKSGHLEAEFTPAGEGKWGVAFRFQFEGQGHVFAGTAEGTLSEGPLKGTVKTDNGKRTFAFSGTFHDGVFTGTHADATEEKEHQTGTLTLKG